jgi:shikimate kinase
MKNGTGNLLDLYEERTPLYEKYGDYVLDIDGLSVRDAANKLTDMLSLV